MTKFQRKWIDGRPYIAPPAAWGGPLTVRQLEVLQLVADGLSYEEIGERLFLTRWTIKTHIRGILKKLDANNAAHAVGIAYRKGLLRPTE